jgi:hypothetical protein
MKISILNRILLLVMCHVAGYQIITGVEGLDTMPMTVYTVGFGVLLVAGLLLMILGFDVLDSPTVVIISTIIPLSLSLGLVWEHLAACQAGYLVFVTVGFLAILLTRILPLRNKLPAIVLAIVHGIAGLTIFLLPISLSLQGQMNPLFSLVGLGGALIGIGGLLLSFIQAGKPILSRETILKVFPGLLLLMTLCFVIGFRYG